MSAIFRKVAQFRRWGEKYIFFFFFSEIMLLSVIPNKLLNYSAYDLIFYVLSENFNFE